MKGKVLKIVGVVLVGLMLLGAALGVAVWASLDDPVVSRSRPSSGAWMLQNVNVVDVVEGQSLEGMDVVIRGGGIESVVPTGSVPFDGETVDASGKWVVPGFIDMHVHVMGASNAPWDLAVPQPEVNLSRLLYAGVTRVFDPGAPTPDILDLRNSVASRDVLGPRIYAAGPVFTVTDGHPAAMMRLSAPAPLAGPLVEAMTRQIDTVEEARAAVRELAKLEPDFVKVAIDRIPLNSPKIAPDVAGAVIDEAKAQGIRPVAHIGTFGDAKQAADLGSTLWIHGVYKEPITQEQAAELAAYDIPMVPTLAVFKSYSELGTDARSPLMIEREMAPAELLDGFMMRPEDHQAHPDMVKMVEKFREEKTTGIENLTRVHEAGVRILAGSDTQAGMVPGGALHRELRLYVKAGLEPAEIIRTATLYPAQFLEQNDDPGFGMVAEGKAADLVVLAANPLDDVENLAAIDSVVLGGERLERSGLK